QGDDRLALLSRILSEEPPSIRLFNAKVPADLETIVLKAMAKDPSDRYATARDGAEDPGRFLEGLPIHARRPTRPGPGLKWSRRHQRIVMAGAFAAILIAAAFSAASWWSNVVLRGLNAELKSARDLADRHSREADANRRTAEARKLLADTHLRTAEEQKG